MHCPIVAKAKKLSQGSAHIATAANESGSASTDSEQGEIWVADATQKPEKGALLYREPQAKASWILDSGATHDLCSDKTILFAVTPARLDIKVANGDTVSAHEKGSWVIKTYVNGMPKAILLTDVFVASSLSQNLISVKRLVKNGLYCIFGPKCSIVSRSGSVVATAMVKTSCGNLTSSQVKDLPISRNVFERTGEENSSTENLTIYSKLGESFTKKKNSAPSTSASNAATLIDKVAETSAPNSESRTAIPSDQSREMDSDHDSSAVSEHDDTENEISSRSIRDVFGSSRRTRPLRQKDSELPESFIHEFTQPATALLTFESLSAAFSSEGTSASICIQPKVHKLPASTKIQEAKSVIETMDSPHQEEWK
ncbi:unnamed protein product [Phytophthora lilii]|uniref:Unnamed protein product n=1 Tax=Phytophthora lilii TaxID=2077276 RepID=A0A9W6YDY3_9STRA|nr:unnamed protein product [Phytophthora lilii]